MNDAPCLLVIDDDPAFNRVLSRALVQRGFEAYGAQDPESALALAREHQPEYVVLDLNLDGSSGLRLIEPLRAVNPDCRILVLTGYASIATTVDAIKLGATQYLAKPADVDAILKALNATDVLIDDDLAPGPCRWIGWNGSTSSACSANTRATSRPPRGRLKCTDVPCNGNWPSGRSRNESRRTPR